MNLADALTGDATAITWPDVVFTAVCVAAFLGFIYLITRD